MLTRLASVSGTLAQTSLVADFGGFLQVCTIKVSHSGGSLHHQKSDRVNPSLRLRGDERELRRISDAIVILDPSGAPRALNHSKRMRTHHDFLQALRSTQK
jgi:hypothetical protein